MNLTNEDVADILALLDSLPYDELDLETPRFRLILRRTPDGWTQSAQLLSAPDPLPAGAAPDPLPAGAPLPTTAMDHRGRYSDNNGPTSRADGGAAGDGGTAEDGEEAGTASLVMVRAPLPGTFYWAPRPGAAPFVEVGSQVGADSVVGIVETMKLMNSVHAGAAGTVAEICLGNGEFAANGATLMRIEVDR